MKGRALLIGLNYKHCKKGHLYGCINDVENMRSYLTKTYDIPCKIITDATDIKATSGMGILRNLYELTVLSYKEDLDFAWIHYSGHGAYIKDTSFDEEDGFDECLVPSDYEVNGILPDDFLCSIFSHFNPKTRVVCVFDCCHSGTIGDLRYSWDDPKKPKIENIFCSVKSKILTISGCLDVQTSTDACGASCDKRYNGALTSCLLYCLKNDLSLRYDVFKLLIQLKNLLKKRGFAQIPKLCSTHDLAQDPILIPP